MPVRRFLPVAFGAVLTACSSTAVTDEPSSPTPEPAPVLELGDFDPEGDFEVFDPCTEIPPEVLAGAGLVRSKREPFNDAGRSISCSYDPVDQRAEGFFVITGDRVPRERVMERGLFLAEESGSRLPGLYLHHMGSGAADECSAAVHTTRGRLVVDYIELLTTRSRESLCTLAVEKLESVHHHLGENNGSVHRS